MGWPMMPRPMKPTFMPDLPICSFASGAARAVGLEPAQARGCPGLGFVLAANPALVAGFVECGEDEGIVDLARAWLVAVRVVGDLHVPDPVLEAAEGRHEVALHDLHVV